jgi:hypothetical protein
VSLGNGTPPRSPGRARRAVGRASSSTDSLALKVVLTIAVVVGVLALIGGIYALSALLFMFAWNVGVDAIVSAAGGDVSNIGFLPSLAAVFAISFVRGIFGGNRTEVSK